MANTENSEEKISGKKFEILLIAFNEFKKEQKNISDFEIHIQDNNEDIEITFVPNFAPSEKNTRWKNIIGKIRHLYHFKKGERNYQVKLS